jgi:hypothetical protein
MPKGEGEGDDGVVGVEGVGEGLFDSALASLEGEPGGVVLSSFTGTVDDLPASAGGDGVT